MITLANDYPVKEAEAVEEAAPVVEAVEEVAPVVEEPVKEEKPKTTKKSAKK